YAIVGVVKLSHVRGVFIHGDVGLPFVPIATPAQLVAVDFDRLGVEGLNIEATVDVPQEALDVGQRETLAVIGEDVLVFAQVIDRPQVVKGGVVLEGVAGQDRALPGLDDFTIGDAVGHFAFDPFAPYATAQGPVADVPGHLPEQRLGGRFDVRAHFIGDAGFAVGQAVDRVLVASLTGAFMVVV